MAVLSVRRMDGEVIRRLKIRAQRDGLSVEETVRGILADAVVDVEPAGAMIRRIIRDDAIDFDLPAREVDDPIDFTSGEYGRDDPE
jgi:plasmid stability protein